MSVVHSDKITKEEGADNTIIEKQRELESDSGPILSKQHRFDIFRSWVRQNILQDLIKEEKRQIYLSQPTKSFFGRMSNEQSISKCYVSYCGSDREKWNSFVNSRTNQNLACVWIPKCHIGNSVRKELNGTSNSPCRSRSNACPMCMRLYKRQYDERGCSWFLFWITNVERARALNQQLIVAVEPSLGIGESQWLEIEWLTLNKYEYKVEIF